MARIGKKAGMIAVFVIAAIALAAGIALAAYVDNNRHGEARDLAKASAACFVEKQVELARTGLGQGRLGQGDGSLVPVRPRSGDLADLQRQPGR